MGNALKNDVPGASPTLKPRFWRALCVRPILAAFSVAVFAFAPQGEAQNWLQRYLREHRPKPAGAPAETPKPATDEQPMEIRRALPADSTDAPASETPPAAPAAASTEAPAAAAPETPVRRAEPVTPEEAAAAEPTATPKPKPTPKAKPTPKPSPKPSPTKGRPIPRAERADATPEPSPTPATPAVPTPAPDAPVLRAQPVAQATPTPSGTPEDQLDPTQNVIRLSPGASAIPADISQINAANAYYAKKDWESAATEYERYLNLFPSGPERLSATYRLAESYRQLGNFNAAKKNYESLVFSLDDGDFVGPSAIRLADICFSEKNYTDALTFFRKASVRLKDPSLVLLAKFNAARCLEYQKFAEDALRAYEDVLTTKEANPFREAAMFAAARLAAASGRRSEAFSRLTMLRQETTRDAVRAEATVRIGLLLNDQGQPTKALAELKKALTMPEVGEWKEVAELGMLRILYNDGKFQAVLETYRAGGKEFSAAVLPEVLLIVATSQRQLGHNAEARALYEQAIRDYPDSVYAREAQYERLITLYSMNAPDLLTEIDEYLSKNPEAGGKRDQLTLVKAESLYKIKRYAEAAPLYALLEDSKLVPFLKAEALFKRGWCLMQVREYPGAITAFTEFLDHYPANRLCATALTQRALSYQKSNNFKAALADFDTLLAQYPSVKERELVLQQKALILGQQEDNQGMVDTFNRLLREFPKSAAAGQANYWVGSVAMQAKKYKDAIGPLENARKLDKDFAERATTLLLWARYSLEERDPTAAEVDQTLANKSSHMKVPGEILRWLGMAYLTADDGLHAERYLGLLTARAKDEEVLADDWLNLGRARAKLKKWSAAQEALQAYLKSAPDPIPQATGLLALGEVEVGAGRLDDARDSANRVLALQPEGRLNSQGRMLLGDIAMLRQDYAEAAKIFHSVVLLGVEDSVLTPKAMENAYIAYKKAGNDQQAGKLLNELQTRFPEHQLTATAAAVHSSSRP